MAAGMTNTVVSRKGVETLVDEFITQRVDMGADRLEVESALRRRFLLLFGDEEQATAAWSVMCVNEKLAALGEVRVHRLKTWLQFFDAILEGRKTFELRKNDRDFRVGDLLELEEWDPGSGEYTNRRAAVRVTYICKEFPGVQVGFCVMGIRRIPLAAVPQRERAR